MSNQAWIAQREKSLRRRVVVVNDDPAILDMYRDLLRELDYEPVAMITTGIATEQIRAHEPDAVILDLQVGDEADYGVSMAIQLRGDSRMASIPIIVCTGDSRAIEGQRQKLRDIAVPMVLKPIDINTLEKLLQAPVALSNRPVAGPASASPPAAARPVRVPVRRAAVVRP